MCTDARSCSWDEVHEYNYNNFWGSLRDTCNEAYTHCVRIREARNAIRSMHATRSALRLLRFLSHLVRLAPCLFWLLFLSTREVKFSQPVHRHSCLYQIDHTGCNSGASYFSQ